MMRLSNSSVEESTQCRSSITNRSGCFSASFSSQARRASKVFCFCRWGVRGGSGKRQQRGEQRDDFFEGEAVRRQRPFQLTQLFHGGFFPGKLEHSVQEVDHRIQRTVLVIRRTAALQLGLWLFGQALF